MVLKKSRKIRQMSSVINYSTSVSAAALWANVALFPLTQGGCTAGSRIDRYSENNIFCKIYII